MPSVEERTEIFTTGIGAIEPTGEFTLQQVVDASDRAQKEVEAPGVVCIDARHATEDQPVREKVGGGNLSTFVFAASAIRWSGFKDADVSAGPSSLVSDAADFLTKAEEILGCHEGNCGANNAHVEITEACAQQAQTDPWTIQAKRHLGDAFNPDHWQRAQDGYDEMSSNERWRKWNAAQEIEREVADHGGVVEKLDGSNPRPDLDPENKRHGHFEQGIRVNTAAGKSNDRDAADIQTFQVDVDPMVRMARKAATSEEEFSLLLHSQVMRQYGIAYVLTKNQPVF